MNILVTVSKEVLHGSSLHSVSGHGVFAQKHLRK